jgi:hypothetical protein
MNDDHRDNIWYLATPEIHMVIYREFRPTREGLFLKNPKPQITTKKLNSNFFFFEFTSNFKATELRGTPMNSSYEEARQLSKKK